MPSLPGYDYVCKTSETKSGGVAFFILSNVNYVVREDLNFIVNDCENLWIEINCQDKKTVLGVIYRHPRYNYSDFQSKFKETIFNLNRSNKPFIICGDFNIDLLKECNSNYKDSIQALGCNQYIDLPTRIDLAKNSSSIINHLYSNLSDNTLMTKVLVHDISDHLPIAVCLQKLNKVKTHSNSYKIRDMSSFNVENFLADLSCKLESVEYYEVDECFDSFIAIFSQVIDDHAPMRERTKKEVKLKRRPWITNTILKSIKLKNKLYKKFIKTKKDSDYRKYKQRCNILTRDKEKAKRKYYDNKIKYSTKNSKLTWQTINEIVSLKKKQKNELKSLKECDGTLTSDPQKMARILNQFFTSIGNNISTTDNSYSPNIPYQKNSFFLKPFSIYEVKKWIPQKVFDQMTHLLNLSKLLVR